MKLLCWRETTMKFEVTADARGQGVGFPLPPSEAASRYEKWVLDVAEANPEWWLPIVPSVIMGLQAIKKTGAKRYEWYGIVSGGAGMKLPDAYVAKVFSTQKVREAKQRAETASANGKRAKPVDVTDVGAAEPSSSPGLA
eukprot:7384763-Prymnesium_polylepis.1